MTAISIAAPSADDSAATEAVLQTALAVVELGQILAPRQRGPLQAYRQSLRRSARAAAPNQWLVRTILLEIAKVR